METLPIISFYSFFLVFLFLLFSSRCESAIQLPNNMSIPAVFAFGDSIVDQGNNNGLKSIVKCNFPPYGKDFQGGVSTGRFSNGRTPPDLIADELGITKFIPAYLDPNLKPQDLPMGVSFASGGTGFDPETSTLVSVIPLLDQLEHFKNYTEKLRTSVGEEHAKFIISNGLHLVVSGSNDLANTYYTFGIRKAEYDIPSYADFIISSVSNFIQKLSVLGARRIAVFSFPPIGCMPAQRTLGGGAGRMCAEDRNQAAQLVNNKLYIELVSLRQIFPQSRIVYIDIYNPLLDLIQHPQTYGFEVNDIGCCGTGKVELSILCNKYSATCADDTKYIFWDSYHPTEKAYKVIVDKILGNYIGRFMF